MRFSSSFFLPLRGRHFFFLSDKMTYELFAFSSSSSYFKRTSIYSVTNRVIKELVEFFFSAFFALWESLFLPSQMNKFRILVFDSSFLKHKYFSWFQWKPESKGGGLMGMVAGSFLKLGTILKQGNRRTLGFNIYKANNKFKL